MNRAAKRFIFQIVLAVIFLAAAPSCSLLERPSATKKYEKIERRLEREARKEDERRRRQHFEMQSEATKRMMKTMKRKNTQWLNSKKR